MQSTFCMALSVNKKFMEMKRKLKFVKGEVRNNAS